MRAAIAWALALAIVAGVTAWVAAAPLSAQAQAMACPGPQAHITIHDYNGPFILDFCIDYEGLSYSNGKLIVSGGDPYADGIFHNGFDP